MLKTSYDRLTDQPFKATREKIDRHLRDINDTISEEDISNVKPGPVANNRIVINDGVIEITERAVESEKTKILQEWNLIS